MDDLSPVSPRYGCRDRRGNNPHELSHGAIFEINGAEAKYSKYSLINIFFPKKYLSKECGNLLAAIVYPPGLSDFFIIFILCFRELFNITYEFGKHLSNFYAGQL